jgi:NAD(P)-dependent dehydrogenase (short-subunit alcohol dehydrogenase family)
MTFDLELSKRRALVTAGTKGLGAAVVGVLSENGVEVVATARSIARDRVPACTTSQRTSHRTTVKISWAACDGRVRRRR